MEIPFRQLKPSPELDKLQKEVQKASLAFSEQINKAKSKWLNQWLKKLMPPKIYNMGRSGTPEQRDEVAKFMEAHEIRMAVWPNGDTDLQVKGRVVSRLIVKWKDGNAIVASKDFPENLPTP